MKPRIALLATGGTIASMQSANGLEPALRAEEILQLLPRLRQNYDIVPKDVFSLDSSNIQPEEWGILAREVLAALETSDGVVITHGTDTMAYTASALSFMLQGIEKPVVITGSQLPLNFPYSDAPLNLEQAFSVASLANPSVYISFHNKVIFGTRAVKMRTLSFDAFDSINAPPVGYFDAEGLHLDKFSQTPPLPFSKQDMLKIDSRVFLLKLMPGTDTEIFRHIKKANYQGLVMEAFGLGGLHYIRRNLVKSLQNLSASGIITLVTTQCLYEKSDFSVYEVGHGILNSKNIYGAHDMTTEAAVTKLMWILADKENRLNLISRSLCHEMIG
jgi:L-asparaginase